MGTAAPNWTGGKIFCVGLHKTGTTSLGAALELLGCRVCGHKPRLTADLANGDVSSSVALAECYDAFEDTPWPLLFEEMDEAFPGSRFVLTTRSVDAWYASVLKHFGGRTTPMREHIYGAGCGDPTGLQDVYTTRYLEHNRSVRDHFAGRPDDLLDIDLTTSDQWTEICSFLGVDRPAVDFPHENRARTKTSRRMRRLAARVLRA